MSDGPLGGRGLDNNTGTIPRVVGQSRRSTAFSPVTLETHHHPETESRLGKRPLSGVDLVIATLLFAAALAVRSPFIIKGETMLHSDEAIVGIMAQDISELRKFPIYFYGQRYMGALEAYVIATLLPLFENPVYALRLGPALFFGLLCGLQYLMLTRWFGRKAALIGAAILIAGPPMFMQWSISARGGYIEILVWGTALLWAYSEWMLWVGHHENTVRHRFLFGVIAGSGLWINPSILFFILPILAHYVLSRVCSHMALRPYLNYIERVFGFTTLPLLAIVSILCLNCVWNVHVENARVQSSILFDVIPKWISIPVVSGVALLIALRLDVINRVRTVAVQNSSMIGGVMLGSAPALLYLVLAISGAGRLDPALPLGVRPLWKIGETLIYLGHGMPLLFGADPRPFETLVCMGQTPTVKPLTMEWSGMIGGANWITLGAIITLFIAYFRANRQTISRLLRIQSIAFGPAPLLFLGAMSTISLYLLGACSHDFNTIRYLLPIWVFIPGLVASLFAKQQVAKSTKLAVATLLLAWSAGQSAMATQLGSPHPLKPVAEALQQSKVPGAVAELFDAHILTYLAHQNCKLIEYKPFWARLAHLPHSESDRHTFLAHTADGDPMEAWLNSGFPGPPPPETQRRLWPALRSSMHHKPRNAPSTTAFPMGYELFRFRETRQLN